MHGPFAMKKDAKFPGFTKDDILGYDPDNEAQTWEVCILLPRAYARGYGFVWSQLELTGQML